MDVLVKNVLNSDNDLFKSEIKGTIVENKITFKDDYLNIFDIEKMTLERISDDIHSYFDFNKSKITYYIKQLDSNLDINMKVKNKKIKENEIIIEYITSLNEEKTNCKYTINWRKL